MSDVKSFYDSNMFGVPVPVVGPAFASSALQIISAVLPIPVRPATALRCPGRRPPPRTQIRYRDAIAGSSRFGPIRPPLSPRNHQRQLPLFCAAALRSYQFRPLGALLPASISYHVFASAEAPRNAYMTRRWPQRPTFFPVRTVIFMDHCIFGDWITVLGKIYHWTIYGVTLATAKRTRQFRFKRYSLTFFH